MRLLYSGILPLGIQPSQETIIGYLNEQIQ